MVQIFCGCHQWYASRPPSIAIKGNIFCLFSLKMDYDILLVSMRHFFQKNRSTQRFTRTNPNSKTRDAESLFLKLLVKHGNFKRCHMKK